MYIMNDKKSIISEINSFDEKKIKLLGEYIIKLKKKEEIKLPDRNNIDKTTNKYKILLKYVNGILKNIDKDGIDDLTKFKDIDRLDIIRKENIQLLDKLAPKLFKYFNKDKCGYYRKTKNLSLNCLRGMCKEIGLELVNRKKDITEGLNGKRYKYTHTFYSIQ